MSKLSTSFQLQSRRDFSMGFLLLLFKETVDEFLSHLWKASFIYFTTLIIQAINGSQMKQ